METSSEDRETSSEAPAKQSSEMPLLGNFTLEPERMSVSTYGDNSFR